MQDEALFATQTPREALHFSASLRLSQDTTEKEREKLVKQLLEELDIEKCADSLIGSVLIRGISGGERKRVAIGVELITRPKLLFLDEPTSGLDTYSAYKIALILRHLCHLGCSVISTIHQPSSEIFYSFDDCILLESGQVVYDGEIKHMAKHFKDLGPQFACPENYNLADHVMFMMQLKETKEQRDNIDKIRKAWEDKVSASPPETKLKSKVEKENFNLRFKASAGNLKQFAMLFKRELLNTIRDRKTLSARVILTVFLNLLYGLVFLGVGSEDVIQSRFGGLFQISLSAMFGCAQPMVLTFPFERAVFIREYLTGTYDALPYFISKFFVEVPLTLAQTFVGMLLGYFLMELRGNFFELWMGMFLLGIVSSSIAVFLGCIATDVKMAVELMPIAFVPQFLFSGFFVQISQIPEFIRWAQWLCTIKYSLNLAMLSEFAEDTPENNALLENNDVDKDKKGFYIGMLFVILFCCRTLALISLRSLATKLH